METVVAKLDQDTPADFLHNHTVGITGKAYPSREEKDDILEISKHPNTTSETLSHIHGYSFDQESGKSHSPNVTESLLKHPNFPAQHAESFAQKHQDSPDIDTDLLDAASQVKGVSHDVF